MSETSKSRIGMSWLTLISVFAAIISAIAAVISATQSGAAINHAAEATNQAKKSNEIAQVSSRLSGITLLTGVINTRADHCFRLAEHYYKYNEEDLSIGASYFNKGRAMSLCVNPGDDPRKMSICFKKANALATGKDNVDC